MCFATAQPNRLALPALSASGEPFLKITFSESDQFTNRNWDHHMPKQKPRHHCRGILTYNFNSTQTLREGLIRYAYYARI
jgi:hypothetical protein